MIDWTTQADPAFLTRPHADESILALAALLDPATLDPDQVHVNQKLVRNMFVHEEVLNILKRPWELSKDQPIISACCLLLKRVLFSIRRRMSGSVRVVSRGWCA